ncbi:mCG145415, partial [Mus musculus]
VLKRHYFLKSHKYPSREISLVTGSCAVNIQRGFFLLFAFNFQNYVSNSLVFFKNINFRITLFNCFTRILKGICLLISLGTISANSDLWFYDGILIV